MLNKSNFWVSTPPLRNTHACPVEAEFVVVRQRAIHSDLSMTDSHDSGSKKKYPQKKYALTLTSRIN